VAILTVRAEYLSYSVLMKKLSYTFLGVFLLLGQAIAQPNKQVRLESKIHSHQINSNRQHGADFGAFGNGPTHGQTGNQPGNSGGYGGVIVQPQGGSNSSSGQFQGSGSSYGRVGPSKSFGDEKPTTVPGSERAWQQNRRAENSIFGR
jgi:hypothetical protein